MAWEDFPQFDSSNIQAIRYDADHMLLEVTFKNGGIYEYFDVEAHVIDEFKASDTMGGFLAKRIKGHYRYSKA